MKYVLLLRGVNVGGRHRVPMADLKTLLLEVGFDDLSTYLNSGNIFLSSDLALDVIREQVARVLAEHFDFEIPFVLLNRDDFLEEMDLLTEWRETVAYRKDALFFLEPEVALPDLSQLRTEHEKVWVGKLGIYWVRYEQSTAQRTFYAQKLLKTDLYPKVTIRNHNTVQKITEYFHRV